MTKKFRPLQCPECKYNNDNFGCMNAYINWFGHTDWSVFRGSTDRKCSRFEKKEEAQE